MKRRRVRHLVFVTTAAIVAAVAVFVTGPGAAHRTAGPPDLAPPRSIRGAFHIHTTRSDGALDKAQVAAAAARAGLQFAIFTDHGDGTRAPDPPRYIDGVLCVDAVEISTNGGHYVALGIPAAPYPLGGEADAVADDVRRLGGFGVAAHPSSPRPELAWRDWNLPIDGLEWLSADTAWRDEGRARLSRALLDYLWRPQGALASVLDRPSATLAMWDRLGATRRVVAVPAHDAHGGLGQDTGGARGRRWHIPSYEATFRAFSMYVIADRSPGGNAEDDARLLMSALRRGRVFTVIDAIAAPAALEFTARAGAATAAIGDELPLGSEPVRFRVRAAVPAGATTTLLRDGRAVVETAAGALDHQTALPGVFRVEVRIPGAPGTPPIPWLLSNPISVRRAAVHSPPREQEIVPLVPLLRGSWRVESDADSVGTIHTAEDELTLAYRLKPGGRTSQYVAFVLDLRDVPPQADGLLLRGRSARPMRVSVQLRYARQGGGRWGRSVYFDGTERQVLIPRAQLRRLDAGPELRPISEATSLLLVIDLTNAHPGAEGRLTLSGVALTASQPER